jgi:hypothetical protein
VHEVLKAALARSRRARRGVKADVFKGGSGIGLDRRFANLIKFYKTANQKCNFP